MRVVRRAPVDARFPALDAVAFRTGFRAVVDFFAVALRAGFRAVVDFFAMVLRPRAVEAFAREEAVDFFFAVAADFFALEPRLAAPEERFF